MPIPDPIRDSLVNRIASHVWQRRELAPIRAPIEAVFAGAQFKALTRDALATLEAQRSLPRFFDDAFITQGPVQDELAAYIVEGNEADIDGLLRRYRDYVADESVARDVFAAYLGQLRQTFANHPTYGNILLARDVQEMYAALLSFRDETRTSFASLALQVETLLNELRAAPAVQAALAQASTASGHIFLSYSRADYGYAMRLKRDLEASGHRVWIDTTSIKGGEEWIDAITDGITRSYAFLSLVSEAANGSKWVRREFLFAEEKQKQIIPIRATECPLPIYLMDANVLPGFADHYTTLLTRLAEQLPTPPAAAPTPTATAPPDPAPEEAYLDRLWMKHKIWLETYTPMAGVALLQVAQQQHVKRRVSAEISQNLSILTKAVQETFGREIETRQEAVDDIVAAVHQARQLLILGDPGAGKSTTMWKLAADYAQSARTDNAAPLPVLIKLGALPIELSVEEALQAELGPDLALKALLAAKRIVLLLDGLNELPAENRAAKVEQIRALVKQAQDADFIAVVTCRELDYTEQLDLGITQRVTIDPLDPLRVHDFVCKHLPEDGEDLFWQLAGGEAVRDTWTRWEAAGATLHLFWTAEDIPRDNPNVYNSTTGAQDGYWREAVHGSRSMMKLARNPYMLFMMTEVFAQTGELPTNRGQLFALFVDFLLLTREHLIPTDADTLKDSLSALAYAMQRDQLGTAVDSAVIQRFLSDDQFYRASSAHLLEGSDEVRFTHQLLQEYFAARKLDQERLAGTSARSIWRSENWWEPTGWEETAILMAGLYSNDCSPVVGWLRDANPELAARCVLESGAGFTDQLPTDLQTAWLPRLTDEAGEPEARSRAAVGRALGRLDLDTRRGVGLTADGLPDMDWVEIPAGKFLYGSDKDKDPDAYDDETPQRELELDTFYISRYPVTYRQFQAFIDAPDGFGDARWWDGLAADAEHKASPREQYFKYWNHPRETVSWYDAMAFCRWLSYRLTGVEPDLDAVLSWPVRLPTEQEWEKAARGPNGLIYPYGNVFDAAKGNTSESGIGLTSAVGMYPGGASPYGVLDMSGNVWEWCLTSYRDGNNQNIRSNASRVLRGGSFYRYRAPARCGYRYLNNPYYGNYLFGFRFVVACPPS